MGLKKIIAQIQGVLLLYSSKVVTKKKQVKIQDPGNFQTYQRLGAGAGGGGAGEGAGADTGAGVGAVATQGQG